MLLIAIVAVLLLLVLNGLFAMSELAVVSARKGKLQVRADRGDKGAAAALRLAEHPTRFLSSVQVGITLIGILAVVSIGLSFLKKAASTLTRLIRRLTASSSRSMARPKTSTPTTAPARASARSSPTGGATCR